jgi:integrase
MRVVLSGLHTVKKALADGSLRTYYYAWRGGPRLKSKAGTPEFIAEFSRLTKKFPQDDTLASLVVGYKSSPEFAKLSDASKRDYAPFFDAIREKFGTMPIEALNGKGPRGEFKSWRDTMAANPRKADRAWAVLRRVLSWAVDGEKITRNPCDRGGRLYGGGERADIIWSPDQIAKVKGLASERVMQAMMLALWTGQRQGDLLRLTWTAYDGTHIRLVQSKTKKRVAILVYSDLKVMLDSMKRTEGTILTNQAGEAWTSDGFKTTWGKEMRSGKLGITGVTFHDLRGTFITVARRHGSTLEQISAASGHSMKEITRVLDAHYLAHDQETNDAVILKMERAKKRTDV